MASKCDLATARLRELGYAFNPSGRLVKVDIKTGALTDEGFKYEISKNPAHNQKHYEDVANTIPEIIYSLLEQNGLHRLYLPRTFPPERSAFIFVQPKKLENSKKLLILIHGMGHVRAGQWSRSIIINNSLDEGSQLPYIKRAQSLGYDLLIMNTNDTYREVNGVERAIPGLRSSLEHGFYVWQNEVLVSQPQSVAIVGHSYGGAIAFQLSRRYQDFFKRKVFAVALTDSAHYGKITEENQFLKPIIRNWVSSTEPLNTPIQTPDNFPSVAAGHEKHEWTSHTAFDSVFKFLEDRYVEFLREKSLDD